MSTQSNDSENVASPRTLRVVSDRHPRLPVTPQRLGGVHKHQHLRAVSSPLTPTTTNANNGGTSSPFTPITNVYNSSSSSADTPNSSSSSCTKVGEISPENQRALKAKSLADATTNWRTRAKENGIKVENEARSVDQASPNDLLPSSFLSTHRRSRQALFQTKSNDGTAFISPRAARLSDQSRLSTASTLGPSSLSNALLATPEPPKSLSGAFGLNTPSPQTSSAIIQSLRQRGCQTDPARPRRRETFGGETSFGSDTLFDIDEDASITSSPRNFSPYSRGFGSPLAVESVRSTNMGMRSVSAPFTAFNISMCDSEEEDELDDANVSLCVSPRSRAAKLRVVRSVSAFPMPTKPRIRDSTPELPTTPEAPQAEEPGVEACSVCSVSAKTTALSALQPCEHRICSSCLTGALNIIGEKDMICAVCERPVQDFKLLVPLKLAIPEESVQAEETESVVKLLPSVFSAMSPKNSDKTVTGSPMTESSETQESFKVDGEMAVLRIDNVPWDVTPKDLRSFFPQHKVVRAHVLLDPKGKTLSHAYVEVFAANAAAALRSAQNKPLGRDKRRRAVTVTMSSQGELMRALFPSWLGQFEGSRPTLSGIESANVATALSNGILSTSELESLVKLMENPKSHFLKSPCLPFYSLVSILSKFPSDRDSRVFWSASLRDVLFEITVAAAGILVQRMSTEYADEELLQIFMQTALDCQVFTDAQRQRILDVMNSAPSNVRALLSGVLAVVHGESSVDESATTSEEIYTPDESIRSMSPNNFRSRYPAQLSAASARMRPSRPTVAMSPAMSPMMMSSPHIPGLTSPHINVPNMMLGNGTPMSPNTAINMAALYALQMQQPNPHMPYQALANEFGVEPDLVAAVAQRLAMVGVGPMNAGGQGMGGLGNMGGLNGMSGMNGMGMFGMM